MRIIFLLLALLAPAQDSPLHVLQQQQAAWNHHDLESFMSGYWKSPDLTFFSTQRTSGWQATLDKYRMTYQSGGHEMGTLEFSDLQVEELSPKAAFVRGSWKLTLSDGKTPHGLFTLDVPQIL